MFALYTVSYIVCIQFRTCHSFLSLLSQIPPAFGVLDLNRRAGEPMSSCGVEAEARIDEDEEDEEDEPAGPRLLATSTCCWYIICCSSAGNGRGAAIPAEVPLASGTTTRLLRLLMLEPPPTGRERVLTAAIDSSHKSGDAAVGRAGDDITGVPGTVLASAED